MNKKRILIGGGIVAFVISAIAGLYVYTKKSIKKVAAAIDDTFDIGDNNTTTIQCQFDLTKTNKNGSSVAKNAFISKEEEEKSTIKMPKISYCCYDAVGIDRAMQNDIDELKERVEKLEYQLSGNCNYSILFDDKYYNDYTKTMDAFFGDDGK